jgi:hypothetical protein
MKYKDVVTFLVSLIFVLSLAYSLGVNSSIWYVPAALFVLWIIIIYKLWIEK